MRCSLGLHTQREYNSVIEFWLDSTEPFATVSYKDGLAPFHSFLSFLLIANLIMVVITIRRTRNAPDQRQPAKPLKCWYLCLASRMRCAATGQMLMIELDMVYIKMT